MKKFVLCIMCFVVFLSSCGCDKSDENTNIANGYCNLLIVGVDGKTTSPEVIMIWQIDNNKKNIDALLIPADTLSQNESLANCYVAYGPKELSKRVSALTNVEIDKYFAFDSTAFEKAVDENGGIKFFMPYTVEADNVTILQGEDVINGKKASALLICDDFPGGEAAKLSLFEDFVREALGQWSEKIKKFSASTINTDIIKTCGTDMKMDEIIIVGNWIISTGQTNFNIKTVEGHFHNIDGNEFYIIEN